MKHTLSFLVFSALIFTIFGACSKPERTLTAAELLDLGEKYLLEMDYEQAVVQFLKVIEIEPMNPRGYMGAAEAYIGLGKPDDAERVLRDGQKMLPNEVEIEKMLDMLRPAEENIPESPPEQLLEPEAPPEQLLEPEETTVDTSLVQGEITHLSGSIEYKYFCVDGIPQSMGTVEENEITETIMAYMRQVDSDGNWSEWEVAPHYWAGLRCTDCGESSSDGSMPDWYVMGFTHAWSGEWKESRIFYNDDKETSD